MTNDPKQTPLAARHEAASARMVDFHGWYMPIQYEGVVAEHTHTRTAASAFDVSHMGNFILRGPHAGRDLGRAVTCRVASLTLGRCRYGLLLNDAGGIEDDLIVYRVGQDEYWVVVNASTIEGDEPRVRAHVSPDTQFENASDRLAMVAVQGPASRDVLRPVVDGDLDGLGYYHCTWGRVLGHKALICRTGYTGELGYEFCVDAACVEEVWDGLIALPGVRPAGLGARDTLRLEMGMPLYGQDLTPAYTPVEANLVCAVDLDKDFCGRDAVAVRAQEGPRERLVGFTMPGRRAARHGAAILHQGEPVGSVTSGSYTPSMDQAIGMGYVATGASEPGTALSLDVRGKMIEGTVVKLPFWTTGTARA